MTTGVAARRAVRTRLERSARGRAVLAALSMIYIAARRRRVCRVHWAGDHWVHRWSTGVVTDLILTSRPPESWEGEARDITLHAYEPSVNDVVIDVGAGVGHETRLLSALVGPRGRVVAIEASPKVYRCLTDMVARNGLANVTCLHLASSDSAGTLLIADVDDHLTASVVNTSSGVPVPAEPVDETASRLGLERVALLKMNIEGGERAALVGASALLQRTANVAISCHDFIADAGGDPALRTLDFARELLEAAGFRVTSRRGDPRPWVRDTLYGSRD